VWITVQWREASVVLEARDDGVGANVTQPDTSARDEMSNGMGGHHGLQGMRERAAALGGEVIAGPEASSGFMVRLKLPFEPSSEKTVLKGK
jgi:signal transduction histidine kinase